MTGRIPMKNVVETKPTTTWRPSPIGYETFHAK
ncbi:hypothetical protein FHT70_006007 [Rhizobium sp. BK049]|nr:hypothetical protein [Rhizobium sp. BK049]